MYYIHIKLSEIMYHKNKRIKNRKKSILSLTKSEKTTKIATKLCKKELNDYTVT